MTTNLIWILYRSDSDTAYKETLNCKKIIEGYGKKVLFSEISNETNNINQLFLDMLSETINNIIENHTSDKDENPINITGIKNEIKSISGFDIIDYQFLNK